MTVPPWHLFRMSPGLKCHTEGTLARDPWALPILPAYLSLDKLRIYDTQATGLFVFHLFNIQIHIYSLSPNFYYHLVSLFLCCWH